MSLGRPNCGNAAAGGGGGGAALPGALGLGSFPRHDLPAPPDGLDLKAVVAPPVSQVAPAPACPLGPQFRARVRTLDSAFSEADWVLRDIQVEIQQMREDGHEKDRQIRSIVEDSEKERQSSHIRIKQFDHDKELMRRFLQGCKENLKKSSDAFLEYKKMCEGSGVSSSGVVADEQNRILMMPQEYAENINALERDLNSSFAACAEEITMLETRITDLKNERQRLNDYIQIPDLNNGGPQL